MMQFVPGAAVELARIGLGRSQIGPGKGDRRWADQAWQQNPALRGAMQAYLYLGSSVDDVVDSLGLEGLAAERLRFALMLAREALAPTNNFWTNPAAVKRCYDTGGLSVWHGAANLARDMRRNHGMPSMVDRKPFQLGDNLAVSPGAVIHRSEVFELIQYTPQRGTVYARPLLVVPPQVNKYYALDLSPGRSMYEYLLQQGIQVFTISWRNPTGAQRDWDFDTYAQAVIEAIDVISAGIRLAGREHHGRLPGRHDGRDRPGAPGRAGRAPDQLRDDDRDHARLRLRRADVPVRVAAAARAGQGGLGPARGNRGLADWGRCSPGCAPTTWCGTTG